MSGRRSEYVRNELDVGRSENEMGIRVMTTVSVERGHNKLRLHMHQTEISSLPFGYKHDGRHASYAGRSIVAIRNIASADRTGQPLGGLPKGERA